MTISKTLAVLLALTAAAAPACAANDKGKKAAVSESRAAAWKRLLAGRKADNLKDQLKAPQNRDTVTVLRGPDAAKAIVDLKDLIAFQKPGAFRPSDIMVIGRTDPRRLADSGLLVINGGEARFREVGRGAGAFSDLRAWTTAGAGPGGVSGISGRFFPGDAGPLSVRGPAQCTMPGRGNSSPIGNRASQYMDGPGDGAGGGASPSNPNPSTDRRLISVPDSGGGGRTDVFETSDGRHYVVEYDERGNVEDISDPDEPPQRQINDPGTVVPGKPSGGTEPAPQPQPQPDPQPKPQPDPTPPPPSDDDTPPAPKPDGDNMPNPEDAGGGGGRRGPFGPRGGDGRYMPNPEDTGQGGGAPGRPGHPVVGGGRVMPNPEDTGGSGPLAPRAGKVPIKLGGTVMPNPEDTSGGGPNLDVYRAVSGGRASRAGALSRTAGFFVGIDACGHSAGSAGVLINSFEGAMKQRGTAVEFTGLRLTAANKAKGSTK